MWEQASHKTSKTVLEAPSTGANPPPTSEKSESACAELKLGLPQHEMQMLASEAPVIHTAGFLQLFLPKAQPPPLA